jgi:leucyl aminopeptidase
MTPESTWKGDLTVVPVPISQTGSLKQPDKRVGDILIVAAPDGQQQLRLSLGLEAKLSAGKVFKAAGSLAKWLYEHEVEEIGLRPKDFYALGIQHALRIFCDGLLLGAFRFKEYKSQVDKTVHTNVLLLAAESHTNLEELARISMDAVAGANYARQVAHQPANVINPESLAERARALAAETGLKVTVLSDKELAEMGAGAILSVGLGSQTGSRMIILEYPGQGAQVGAPPVIVVGKAITFDTGGYSLKSTTSIVGMKYDKCGGAAVLGIMQAVDALQIPSPVVGMIAAAENMISEDAYRPNDIITTLSGQTVEVISTDAEGRMVLSDALTYAHTHYQPRAVIDIATLTGGIVVSLGKVRAGLMSNNNDLAEALFAAGERTYERLWRMPLDDEYFELIKGYDSDFMNSSGIRQAHPVTGGIFLKQFVPDEVPWAHLDIAGTASTGDAIQKALPYPPRGATGFGVRLVVDYLQNLA